MKSRWSSASAKHRIPISDIYKMLAARCSENFQRRICRLNVYRRSLLSTTVSKYDYDILICGGGVVGAALASKVLHITGGNFKIGIIEPRKPMDLENVLSLSSPDKRVYALSPKSINLLKSVHAWDKIASRSQPYSSMQVWEASGPGYIRFASEEMNEPELGRITEDIAIQASLFDSLKKFPSSVDYIFNATVSDIRVTSSSDNTYFVDPAKVTFKSGSPGSSATTSTTVSARLVVGADGGNSAVRRLVGISSWGWTYGQTALVGTVRLSSSGDVEQATNESTNSDNSSTPSQKRDVYEVPNHTAWQVYLPTGPLALLPLWGNEASFVWSLPTPLATQLMSLPAEEFTRKLNDAFQQEFSTAFQASPSSSTSSGSNDDVGSGAFSFKQPFPSNVADGVKAGLSFAKSIVDSHMRKVTNDGASVANMVTDISSLQQSFQKPPLITSLVSDKASFPLTLQQASCYTSPRVALIGDAAHSIHPQAGQGLNMGLRDVEMLAEVIASGLASGQDIGSELVLQQYGRPSYLRNLRMLATIDSVNTLFSLGQPVSVVNSASESADFSSPHSKIARAVRAAGMLGLNSFKTVKSRIARFAMDN